MDSLVSQLFEVDAVKFGDFQLKSGLRSPIYLDLRVIVGYPNLMSLISDAMFEVMEKDVDQLCGVPYTAFPLSSCISIKHNIPSVIKRREAKAYGTKKLIEGVFKKGMKCCIIEDVITTGSSIIETAKELRNVGLIISEAVILVDRGQGGRENLENDGIKVKSLLTLDEILSTLLRLKKISKELYDVCVKFINDSQIIIPTKKKLNELSWNERSESSENNVVKRLFHIMESKKTKLCVAVDVLSMSELLTMASEVAPYICMLKIHADIINDFDINEMMKLKELSIEKQFILMEDRKLADIGNTVRLQMENTKFDYLSWCDLVTVHCLPGDGILNGIRAAARSRNIDIGCVLITEMSSNGAFVDTSYKDFCIEMALRHKDIVAGFVSQSLVTDIHPGFVHCTPGVKLTVGGDCLGQNYRSIESLNKAGYIDVFIVGRGVSEAENVKDEAKVYRDATFSH